MVIKPRKDIPPIQKKEEKNKPWNVRSICRRMIQALRVVEEKGIETV